MESSSNDNKTKKELTPSEHKMATANLKSLVLMSSIPTIIGMLINALYNVVDKYWVGQIPEVGELALAGVGLSNPIMLIFLAFAQLIGIGAAATISIYLGKRDKDTAEKIIGNSLTLSIIISIILTIVFMICKEYILTIMETSENTRPFANDYITIIAMGTIFNVVSFSMNHPIRAVGANMRFASTQILGALTNIILDPILIIHFNMGVKGAAIATIFSMFISSTWVMSYYFTGKSVLKLRVPNLKLNKDISKEVLAIGFSPFIMQIAAAVISLLINKTLRYYGNIEFGDGDIAISAMTVINGFGALILMPIFGINQGTQPILGFNYGYGDYNRVRETYKWSVIYSIIIVFFGFLLVEFWAVDIVKSFNSNPTLIDIGSYGMRIAFSAILLVGFQVPSANFFTAIGRAKVSIILSLLRQVILLVPAYLILPIFFGFSGIWFATPFADIIASIVTFIFVAKEFKILKSYTLNNLEATS